MKVILVDGNAIGYASHNATKLHVGDFETQAVYGVVRTIRDMQNAHPSARIIVLWDAGAKWRYELYPDYKGNRSDTPEKRASKEAYKAQIPYMEKALRHLNIRQMRGSCVEADDLAGVFSRKLVENSNKVILVTGDGDWIQLVGPHVTWVDPIRDRQVTHKNFIEYTGMDSPEQFIDHKALIGDASDNIKGVGGIGEKKATELLLQFGRVSNFIHRYHAGELKGIKLPKAFERLANNEAPIVRGKQYPPMQESFYRNKKLMNLLSMELPEDNQTNVELGEWNPDAFQEMCEELQFSSIVSSLDTWLKPFSKR